MLIICLNNDHFTSLPDSFDRTRECDFKIHLTDVSQEVDAILLKVLNAHNSKFFLKYSDFKYVKYVVWADHLYYLESKISSYHNWSSLFKLH